MTNNSDYFKTFCKISQAFGTAATEEELLGLVVRSATEALDGKAACIYLADIGDNQVARDSIVLYRLPDPGSYDGQAVEATAFPMAMPKRSARRSRKSGLAVNSLISSTPTTSLAT